MGPETPEAAGRDQPTERRPVLHRHLAPLDEQNERFVFLAEASSAVTASLDYDETLQALADVVVPALADWCSVSVVDPDGSIRRVAVNVANTAKKPLADRLREGYPTDPGATTGVAQVIRTGESQLFERVPEQLLVETAHNDEYLAIQLALGFKSAMLIPLAARGRILGEITLVASESGRTFSNADLAFAEDLAQRAALAIDNARLHGEVLKQRARYEKLVNSVRAIVWEATPGSGRYDFVSHRVEDILGHPAGRWLTDDTLFWSSVHPDDIERVREMETEIHGGGEEHVLEFRVLDAFGAVHWMRNHVHVERDDQGSPALLRGVMVDVSEQHEREEALTNLAATLQASLLPPQQPDIPGLDVAARYAPAERGLAAVGGDFYDVFPVTEGVAGAIIGDVCGKGAEAAALTALARYTLRSSVVQTGEPAQTLAQVNRILVDETTLGERYATAVLVTVDLTANPRSGAVGVAGHVKPLVVRSSGQVEVLQADGMPLGLFEGASYVPSTVTLEAGDTIVLVTDGVTEARNSTGDLFGEDRVRGVLEGVAGEPAAVVADSLVERVRSFAGAPLRDDAAVLVLRVPA